MSSFLVLLRSDHQPAFLTIITRSSYTPSSQASRADVNVSLMHTTFPSSANCERYIDHDNIRFVPDQLCAWRPIGSGTTHALSWLIHLRLHLHTVYCGRLWHGFGRERDSAALIPSSLRWQFYDCVCCHCCQDMEGGAQRLFYFLVCHHCLISRQFVIPIKPIVTGWHCSLVEPARGFKLLVSCKNVLFASCYICVVMLPLMSVERSSREGVGVFPVDWVCNDRSPSTPN